MTSVIAAKQRVINEVYGFFLNKISLYRYFIEKYINIIYSADLTIGVIRQMDFTNLNA